MGCIGYELCLGRRLAGNRFLLKQHIAEGRKSTQPLEEVIESIPSRFGTSVRNIIKACLAWEPEERCTADQLRDYILENR